MNKKMVLKDNRNIYVIDILIIIMLLTIMNIFYFLTTVSGLNFNISPKYIELIIFGSLEIITIIVLLVVIFYKRKKFIMTSDKIETFNSNKKKSTIYTKDITRIYYIGFNLKKYFNGLYDEKGISRIVVETINHSYSLGRFSIKDAQIIKNFYPELFK